MMVTIEQILETLLVLALVLGLGSLVFDFIDIKKIMTMIFFPIMLIILGFFFGIGIHYSNVIFNW